MLRTVEIITFDNANVWSTISKLHNNSPVVRSTGRINGETGLGGQQLDHHDWTLKLLGPERLQRDAHGLCEAKRHHHHHYHHYHERTSTYH